jgi:hypothetical protein
MERPSLDAREVDSGEEYPTRSAVGGKEIEFLWKIHSALSNSLVFSDSGDVTAAWF